MGSSSRVYVWGSTETIPQTPRDALLAAPGPESPRPNEALLVGRAARPERVGGSGRRRGAGGARAVVVATWMGRGRRVDC